MGSSIDRDPVTEVDNEVNIDITWLPFQNEPWKEEAIDFAFADTCSETSCYIFLL